MYAIEVSLPNFNTTFVQLSSLALFEPIANEEEFATSIAFNKTMGEDSRVGDELVAVMAIRASEVY